MSKEKGGSDIPADIAKMSFESALEELEKIVQDLEQGSVSLEGSIDAYTRGTQLKRHCEAKLKDAQARVDKIVTGSGGEAAGLESADVE
jgi:exodeoxyribonuclease VII small subunit